MSRFAADPHWLIYLPPTMARRATTSAPRSARAPGRGVRRLPRRRRRRGGLRGEAHGLARRRAGLPGPGGARPLRHRRRRDGLHPHRAAVLRAATSPRRCWTGSAQRSTAAGLWDELDTDWLLLDAELLPWSAKAGRCSRGSTRAVGAAAPAPRLPAAVAELTRTDERGVDVSDLLAGVPVAGRQRRRVPRRVPPRTAGRPTGSRRDAGAVLGAGRPRAARSRHGPRLAPGTGRPSGGRRPRTVHARHGGSRSTPPPRRRSGRASTGGRSSPAAGGEGMVVKPMANLSRGAEGLVQPGVKCRGREYLRIIYGPDYTEPAAPGRAAESVAAAQAVAGAARVRAGARGARPAGRR